MINKHILLKAIADLGQYNAEFLVNLENDLKANPNVKWFRFLTDTATGNNYYSCYEGLTSVGENESGYWHINAVMDYLKSHCDNADKLFRHIKMAGHTVAQFKANALDAAHDAKDYVVFWSVTADGRVLYDFIYTGAMNDYRGAFFKMEDVTYILGIEI